MQKYMRKLGAALMVVVVMIAAWEGVWGPLALAAAKAPVAETGHTQCWDTMGSLISCADTGQDGEIQAGMPFPTPRFTARKGAVKDNLTGLTWLQNATCDTLSPNLSLLNTWQEALDAANALGSGSCSLTDGSVAGAWRLPNVKELQSLLDFSQPRPALPPGHPFVDIGGNGYWSSTTYIERPNEAWHVNPLDGNTVSEDKSNELFLVWPVRGGQ